MIKECVTPIKSVCVIIHCQTIWPSQGCISEDLNVGSIHICSTDVGRPVPFTEEQVATIRMNNNCSGSFQILQQCSSVFMILGREHIQSSFEWGCLNWIAIECLLRKSLLDVYQKVSKVRDRNGILWKSLGPLNWGVVYQMTVAPLTIHSHTLSRFK